MEQWKIIFESMLANHEYEVSYDKEAASFRTRFIDAVLENEDAAQAVYDAIDWPAIFSAESTIARSAKTLECMSYCTPKDPMEHSHLHSRFPESMIEAGLVVTRSIVAFVRAEFDTLLEWHRQAEGIVPRDRG